MSNKAFLCSLVLILLSACSGLSNDYQSPAPVYESSTDGNYYKTNPQENSQQTTNTQVFEKSESSKALSDENSRQLSPAVLALVAEAENHSKQGDLESAVVTIERALRIESRNPILTYKLAKLRLKQSKPQLAEDLAKKAALLSANDKILKKHCWLLISEARKQQNNHYGANEARLKADQI